MVHIRPFRMIYLITLTVLAFMYCGTLAGVLVLLATCDLEVK